MAIPKLPAQAWLRVAAIVALFFVAFITSGHLWLVRAVRQR